MKKIVQLLIFFTITYSTACDCSISNFTEKFSRSEFVAEIKITKIFLNEGEEELYKANIEILNLFKGDSLKSIFVEGRSDKKMGSSCAIFIPEETELIAYAYKNKDGKYVLGMCSGLTYTKKYYHINEKRIEREMKMLSILKHKGVELNNKIHFDNNGYLDDKLEGFKGIKLDKDFAIFEIKFSSNLKVKKVKIISGFENSIDDKLVKILKTIEWRSYYKGQRNKVPNNQKLLFEINYYANEKGIKSFLTKYLL